MKKLVQLIKNNSFKRFSRNYGCEISNGLQGFKRNGLLLLEEQTRLGNVLVESPRLTIGAHTYIRSGAVLSVVSGIGRFCSFGSNCVVGQEKNSHPSSWLSTHPFQYENAALSYSPGFVGVTIGHDVWVGHDATIMEGVVVGTGAIIATKAMVTREVPPYAIVAGNPAKIIKYRHSPEVIERLLASKWWELDIAALRKLPLNDPEASLALLEQATDNTPAVYKTLEITQRGFKVVG